MGNTVKVTINHHIVVRRNRCHHHPKILIGSDWKRTKGGLFKLEKPLFSATAVLLERTTIEPVSEFKDFLVEVSEMKEGVMTVTS